MYLWDPDLHTSRYGQSCFDLQFWNPAVVVWELSLVTSNLDTDLWKSPSLCLLLNVAFTYLASYIVFIHQELFHDGNLAQGNFFHCARFASGNIQITSNSYSSRSPCPMMSTRHVHVRYHPDSTKLKFSYEPETRSKNSFVSSLFDMIVSCVCYRRSI